MTKTPPRLSEQELAQLYLQTEAPLRLDDLLQEKAKGDGAQIAIHDSISDQTPDLALISLSLCGLIIARDFPVNLKDGPYGPVLRELILNSEDNLMTVGRLWLDSANGIRPHPKSDRPVIESIPDRLRILTSIFMELIDALDGENAEIMSRALKTLYYQSESHADLADKFVEDLAKAAKKARGAAGRPVPDQIPLPFDLRRPHAGGAEIVAFSLFHQKRHNP